MKIRDALPADWRAIEAMLRACELPLEGAHDHRGDFLVFERENVVAGCVGAELYGDAALLRSLAVAEDARGSGVGHALVETMLSRLKARKVQTIALLTSLRICVLPQFQ